ncbi:hypothetical protein WR25_05978 [Diploscapter pachys]|uniref:Enoyl reductase (ER) domain-containing protein n=1 Tax=Diploscapter pachys TaxID=2018661 RepID=A0A2A2LQ83_9BILA|nr:hypothetical protein WR25_05978 [Diploscapter pachys]
MKLCRPNLAAAASRAASGSMKAWLAESPTIGITKINHPIPTLKRPNDVLIRVKAASVNTIDTKMVQGYGDELLGIWHKAANCNSAASRFPMIPGRDCSGTVESVGPSVHSLRPGDEVIAVVPAIEQGAHAEFTVTPDTCCAPKPRNLSFTEAASVPYVACTSWASLVTFARMNPRKKPSERVLINGGSGGLGTMAIQMLKSWGVEKVVATCSKNSFELVRSLGAIPIDYAAPNATDLLIELAPFEVILDCVDSELAKWSDHVMGTWRNCVHVSVVSPLMSDTDRYGVITGLFSTAAKHFNRAYKSHMQGRWYTYAYFMPNQECLLQVSKLLEEGKIKPIVEKVYKFDEMPAAYEKVSYLHGKGKTVVEFD